MLRIKLLLCALCFVLAGGRVASAQTPQAHPGDVGVTESEEQFDEAARAHKVELHDLGIYRGVPMIVTTRSASPAHGWVPEVLREYYLPGTSVLFYGFHSGQLSTWLITSEGIIAHQTVTTSADQLAAVINDLRLSLDVEAISLSRAPIRRGAQPATVAEEPRIKFQDAGMRADALLLPEPIAEKLKQTKYLIVVPVLGIGSVPYALLRPFSGSEYLIDKMWVSIAPSLFDIAVDDLTSNYNRLSHARTLRWAFGPSIVVGNPDVSSDPDWIFPPLPGAEKEAKTVATMVHAQALTGRAASKSNISDRLSDADFLYFATHGVADPENPVDGSFLALSGSTRDEIHWTAREIQYRRLRASLAVLSACQTGLGKSHDAGIIGLARAFQIAGVAQVIMSLWSVDDEATSQLMQEFISNLNSCVGESECNPAEALRAAILEFKSNHPDPKLWAPFVVFGTFRWAR